MAKLYFHYAAMNAGKSTSLLQASFNYRERGMATLEFTPSVDTRFEPGIIASRIGLRTEGTAFDADTDFFPVIEAADALRPLGCVFLDEAQFLSGDQVRQLARIVDELSIPVMCFGLRTDFRGELFEGAAALFALADEVRELKTICHCGRKATMNLRIDADGKAVTTGDRIDIGGNDRYAALCRKHFFEAFGRDQPNAP